MEPGGDKRKRELMSFGKRLASGEFLVLAEMNTPKGVDVSELETNARRVKGRIDAVIVPDMDNGVMRMSAMAGGVLMHRQGIEAVMHVYCRDRNRMALQGDILAAHVLGIQNLVVVCSEDMAHSDHPQAKPVNDLDEVELLQAIRALQEGTDLAGCELTGSPCLTVGCKMAPCQSEQALAQELALTRRKVEAGAQFIITPPVFDLDYFTGLLGQLKELQVPVIATVFLLKSVGMARYIATNEPSARLSEETIKRLRKAPDRENEGIRIAGETVASLKKLTQGVQISTLGWEYRLPAILDYAGL